MNSRITDPKTGEQYSYNSAPVLARFYDEDAWAHEDEQRAYFRNVVAPELGSQEEA